MILDTIVARKREEVAALRSTGIRGPGEEVAMPRGFARALTSHADIAIIAEAKKGSPSKGLIRPDFDPAAIAESYKKGGARAISVLTDRDFFFGDISYLPLVRRTVDLPVLRKDFIIDPLQIDEARAYGADAILLIAAILEQGQMAEYRLQATELGMDVLVEVHDEEELEKALAAGSTLIGVNNRDLRDFTVDLETTFRLKRLLPAGMPLVSESGIRDRVDISRLREEKITAALIGESLMRAADPGAALAALLG